MRCLNQLLFCARKPARHGTNGRCSQRRVPVKPKILFEMKKNDRGLLSVAYHSLVVPHGTKQGMIEQIKRGQVL